MFTIGLRGKAATFVAGIMVLTLASARSARAQDDRPISVTMSQADKTAAAQVTNHFRTATPLYAQRANSSRPDRMLALRPSHTRQNGPATSMQKSVRYPADLSYLGGAVVNYAQSHAVYLLPNATCPVASCWGNP
ncbi:MAG TPA: hypothetical protein VMI32_23135 [Candidatus Solibacter sp.]|nr:hypothetical protein [Candidatus Solibacter sp.]